MPPFKTPKGEIDDRWLLEWFEHGMRLLAEYLARWAEFEEWLRHNGRR